MADPIQPRRLLQQAGDLALGSSFASSGDSPLPPEVARFVEALPARTTVDFRRAISAAYYAVFHAITVEAAGLMSSGALRYELARAFNHRDLVAVAAWILGGTPPEGFAETIEQLRRDDSIREVAVGLRGLSKARAQADYDHSAELSQSQAVAEIRVAAQIVSVVESPEFSASPAGRLFLGLIALRASSLR